VTKKMPEPQYTLADLGDRRVRAVGGREYATVYSTRVIQMLIDRKGIERTPPYLTYKETRGPHLLGPLFRHLRARGVCDLSVLEVGCSFGHMTLYLAEQPEVAAVSTFDTDATFVAIVRAKVAELGTRRLSWADGAFDLVVAVGVVEHLPARNRRAQVDEYYRVLAPGGYIAILDTPNRWFPLETHSVGLPLVQWLRPRLAWRYVRSCRPDRYGRVPYAEFVADGTGWRNATLADCLPSSGWSGIGDLTEAAGYGWRFFRGTARSRTRRALLPLFAAGVWLLRAVGLPPSLCLPYLNLLFRRVPRAG